LINKLSLLIFCIFIFLSTFAQNHKLLDISWRNNWKMEIKTGAVSILSHIPDNYFYNTNNLNVPIGVLGPLGTLSLKKGLTPHFEMGYQFDYLRLQGQTANVEGVNLKVLTQMYTHNFLLQYNFKKNNEIIPIFNYFLYLKMGGIFMENNPVKQEADSPLTNIQNHAIPQAFVSGLGAGINYQLSDNFSLIGSLDINNSANGANDIFQLPKLFTSNHINYYSQLSFGLAWWFDIRRSASQKDDSSSIWYDSRWGKMEKRAVEKMKKGESEKVRTQHGTGAKFV